MAALRRALLLLGVALTSCGDPIVDASFRGNPLVTFEGEIRGEHPDVELGSKLVRLALFMSVNGTMTRSFDDLRELRSASVAIEVPRSWSLSLFDPPSDGFLTSLKPGGARFAVGRLLAYKDANENHQYDSEEPIVGADLGRVVVYAPQAMSAADSPTGLPLPPGFHLILNRMTCRPQTLMQPPEGRECNVPLGISCKSDADCGEGVCLRDTYILPWPGGACVVRHPPPQSCRPKGANRVKDPQEPSPRDEGGYWVKSCEMPSDCDRPALYTCDQGTRACLPSAHIRLEIGPGITLPPFCQ
jgi:hypothetical protein